MDFILKRLEILLVILNILGMTQYILNILPFKIWLFFRKGQNISKAIFQEVVSPKSEQKTVL